MHHCYGAENRRLNSTSVLTPPLPRLLTEEEGKGMPKGGEESYEMLSFVHDMAVPVMN